jgi:hypothetical protein
MVYKNLHICLPRLVAVVREVRSDGDACERLKVIEAFQLASTLNLMEDTPMEDRCLHAVTVAPTANITDRMACSHSFWFPSEGLFSTAVAYWHTRIFTHRLCLELQRLCSAPPGLEFDEDKLIGENKRLANNIIMSWGYAANTSGIGVWAMRLGLLAVWAATRDIKGDWWRISLPLARLQYWILRRYCDLHNDTKTFTADEMDEAADLLAGGPLQGMAHLQF